MKWLQLSLDKPLLPLSFKHNKFEERSLHLLERDKRVRIVVWLGAWETLGLPGPKDSWSCGLSGIYMKIQQALLHKGPVLGWGQVTSL